MSLGFTTAVLCIARISEPWGLSPRDRVHCFAPCSVRRGSPDPAATADRRSPARSRDWPVPLNCFTVFRETLRSRSVARSGDRPQRRYPLSISAGNCLVLSLFSENPPSLAQIAWLWPSHSVTRRTPGIPFNSASPKVPAVRSRSDRTTSRKKAARQGPSLHPAVPCRAAACAVHATIGRAA